MHARRIASTLLAAATAVVLGAGAAQAADHDHGRHGLERDPRASVELGRVHHDRDARREWITVVNTGRHGVDLEGWTLSDRDRHTYRFGHLYLRGHDEVRVYTGRGRDHRHEVFQGRWRPLWDREDTAVLRDDRGRVIDRETWGDRDRHHGRHHDGRGRGDHDGRDHDGRGHDGRGRGDHDGRGDHNDPGTPGNPNPGTPGTTTPVGTGSQGGSGNQGDHGSQGDHGRGR
ncbi:lamin tail domain-containing protein [Streptomyces sp. NPDC001380]|uniref:lamin tail domain-containing protein n=1 Tax=Streptomyces sp. NPDC001380 TaxID=3364566 RepID=UPI0036961808